MRTVLGWAPEVPDHWTVIQLKFVAKIGTGHTPDRTRSDYWENCTVPWVTIPDAARRADSLVPLTNTDQCVSELGLANSAAVLHPAGTVMLSRTASVGYSLSIGRSMATTQDFMTWTPSPALDSDFLLLLLRAMKPEWERLAFGSTHRTIYMPDLESLRIPLPPVDEQRRISSFVGAEVGRVNELVAKQHQVVSLLEERIDSQILHIVGGSSLVDRRGSPASPMKRLLEKRSRRAGVTAEMITAFRNGQVTSRSARKARGYTLAADAVGQGQGVKVGDVVVHGLDGFAGAIGDAETSGNCSPVYHICTPLDGGDSTFYGRMLRVLALNGYLGEFATSTRERAVDFRNWSLFGGIPIPHVDPAVQRQIGQEIRTVRPLREEVERFNDRLAERRQALIAAAVTGQIDVKTARGGDK